MVFLRTETSPSALQHWSDAWQIFGYAHVPLRDPLDGDIDLGKSPFFRLRLGNAIDDFLARLAKTLSRQSQFIKRDDPSAAAKKFAVSSKSYTSTALKRALQGAACMAWRDSCALVYISNIGAKMEISEYMAKATAAHAAHEQDMGTDVARIFAQNSITDVGLDVETTGFLAVG